MNVPTALTFDTAHTIGVDIRHTCQQRRQWWGDVESQVGGVDTMYDVSTVCRQLRDGVYRCYECRHGWCGARYSVDSGGVVCKDK